VAELQHQGIDKELAVSATMAAENEVKRVADYVWLGGINRKYDFCIPNRENEQIYLEKYFRKDTELLEKLKVQQKYTLWLAATSETSPLLFEVKLIAHR
jgi:hypothetical protein